MYNTSEAKKELEKHTLEMEALIPKVVESVLPEIKKIALLLDSSDRSLDAIKIGKSFAETKKTKIDAFTIIDPQLVALIGKRGLKLEEETVTKKLNMFIAEEKVNIELNILREATLDAIARLREREEYDLLIMPIPYFDVRTDREEEIIDVGLVCEQIIKECTLPLVVIPKENINVKEFKKHIGIIVLDPMDTEHLISTAIDLKDIELVPNAEEEISPQISTYFVLDCEYMESMDYFIANPDQLAQAVEEGIEIRRIKSEQTHARCESEHISSKELTISENVAEELANQIKNDKIQLLITSVSPPPADDYKSTRILDLIVKLDEVAVILFLRTSHEECKDDKEEECEEEE